MDGGKGQLSAAVGVLRDLDLADVPVAGLAKRFEELYLPGRPDPIVLPRKSQGLYLVQRIRDEAHRFAITYHRNLRSRRALAVGLRRHRGDRPGAQEGAPQALRQRPPDPGGIGR